MAFAAPVIMFISLITETQSRLHKNLDKTDVDVIYIDNFPIKHGYLTSGYGMRKDPFNGRRRMHRGIDIAAPKGSSIHPLGKGTVVFVGRKAGYGKTVEILHGNTIISRYCHLKKALVKKGQKVGTENIIAQVGNSGRSTGPHLHLEITINGETVDPQTFLIGSLASR